jgi:putative YphP/YqiW family bacilliredoxin
MRRWKSAPGHRAGVTQRRAAGGDLDATARAREYFMPYPPSSPSVALLKDGKLVYMMERRDIEGSPADVIAQRLQDAFKQHCA